MISETINTTHSAMIHDLAYNYYGDRLATCASDGYVHIYDVSKQQSLIATIKVGDAPLWSICWAHPRFGNVIAVCSFDGIVTIYKESKEWSKVAHYQHSCSVNSIAWYPQELILACGGSDGSLFLLDNDTQWGIGAQQNAHDANIHGVAWNKNGLCATASSDKSIKVWDMKDGKIFQLKHFKGEFSFNHKLSQHTELVRTVQWHPIENNVLVSGGEDGKVIFYQVNEQGVQVNQVVDLHLPVWKVDFNLVGNRLLVSLEGNGIMKTVILEKDNQSYEVVQELD